jgi:hypothetical protein
LKDVLFPVGYIKPAIKTAGTEKVCPFINKIRVANSWKSSVNLIQMPYRFLSKRKTQ